MNSNFKRNAALRKRLKERQLKLNHTKPVRTAREQLGFFQRVKAQEISNFTRQLSTMIEAKLSLTRALEILVAQINNQRFKNIVEDILQSVKGGKSFALSLKKHGKVFGNLYISMVEVGEIAGILDLTLNRLATHLEKMSALRRKFFTAMSYPAIIIFVAIGAITFLLVAIVPTFAEMFHDFGAELPFLTQLIIDAGQGAKNYGIYILLFFIILSFLIKKHTQTGKARYARDKLLLHLPFWGEFIKKMMITRFCRTFATLIESGVSLLEALEIAAVISGNKVFEKSIYDMKSDATKGALIAESMSSTKIFPPVVIQMILVGEETAKLDTMAHKIADFYDEEVNATIDTLTSVIEPVIIVFLGIVLGGTIVAMYLQIFNLMDVIQ